MPIDKAAPDHQKKIDRPSERYDERAGVIDQRQQQIDPAGKHRVDPDAREGGDSAKVPKPQG